MKRREWSKAIAGALLCTLLCALLSGCAGREVKQVHLTIKTPPLNVTTGKANDDGIGEAYDLLKKAAIDFADQYTDAEVTFDVVKFDLVDERDYVGGCFDTENAADVLFEGYFNMFSYIYTGRVVSLDDVIDSDLKDDFSPAVLAQGTVNGKTYMLPFYSLFNTLCYNKDLFRDCGLDAYIRDEGVIAHWSNDDWDHILTTLADRLPEMVFPMMMYGKNYLGDTHIMTLLRKCGCPFFDADGNVCVNTPEGIEALRWIARGHQNGWFPAGAENLEIDDCTILFDNGQLAISFTNNAFFPSMDHDRYGLVNFPADNDTGHATMFTTGFMVFDNGDEDKLEVAKAFVKYFYGRDDLLDYEAIAIPANLSAASRVRDRVYMLEAYEENLGAVVDFTGNSPNWQGESDSVRSVFRTHIRDLLAGKVTPEECARAIDDDCNAAIRTGRENGSLHE